jgi:hypothetical protein
MRSGAGFSRSSRPRCAALPLGGLLALLACGAPSVRHASADEYGEDDGDGDEDPARVAEVEPAAGYGLVPRYPATGNIAVRLHPGKGVAIGRPTVVSFGVPFPPGVLSGADQLSAFQRRGAELRMHADAILPWRVWPGRKGMRRSVRAAMVSVEVTFPRRAPLDISLRYGAGPGVSLPAPRDPRAGWVAMEGDEYPAGTVREPRVYATFSPRWLGSCLLRTRSTPAGADRSWAWFDEAMLGFARTAVNDVPESVTRLIDYTTDYGAWLFDRTATLFGVYVRTGDVKWMRHAHRSAQFYMRHVTDKGVFDLKAQPDLKYSYGRSLLMDFIFTGDPELLAAIERVAAASLEWNPVYGARTNFWTERHQAYALLAALSAWQASGSPQHAARAREVARATFAMSSRPGRSWKPDGCPLHTMESHEGAGGEEPICSPWMSALLADAVWEYYIHSEDREALVFLAGLGHFVADYGLYPGDRKIKHTMPWYLASSVKTFSDDGPWGDVEHNCDVAGMVARAAWAEKQLGKDPGRLRKTAADLLGGCKWSFENWHRPNGPASGKAEWRLAPPRKFNWWFGSTTDLAWLMKASATR